MDSKEPPDLTSLRAHFSTLRGKAYWRSLEELADTEEFQALLLREFPRQALAAGTLSRRQFLKLTAASLALAGLGACSSRPAENILPYAKQPEQLVPGNPLYFATALTLGGYATGVLVKNQEGRPIKIEGNPDHPASLGATDAFAQAAILTLYDPDRGQADSQTNHSWQSVVTALTAEMNNQRGKQGAGLRILTETVTSPTLGNQLQQLLKQYPAAKWVQYEPVGRDNIFEGAQLAFGNVVEPHYRFDKADVIVSLDSNFLQDIVGGIRYTHDFTEKRQVRSNQTKMNRLYAVESTPTITGAMADHRLAQRPSQIVNFAFALAQQLGVKIQAPQKTHTVPDNWLTALVRDLQQHHGTSLIVAGYQQPAIVHALAYAMNDALGNTNQTVIYTDPVAINPVNQLQSLHDLVQDMNAGQVDMLVIVGGNPVYTAPADLKFAEALAKVHTRVHLSLYQDETSKQCNYNIPEAHSLESWSDARAYDGTVSIVQPLIAPLYDGKSAHELLAALSGQPQQTSHDIVRAYWQTQNLSSDAAWHKALHDGLIAGSALPAKQVTLQPNFAATSNSSIPTNFEIIFQPDPTIWDGRFANNGWLQELPRPLTLLTWDNVALVSPATAGKLQLSNGDVVELAYKGQTLRAPIWIQPGHADDAVTVTLGYGRTEAGQVGSNIGYNAYRLRMSAAPWLDFGLEVRKTGETYALASTQGSNNMENRDLIRATTIEHYLQQPDYVHDVEKPPTQSLYSEQKYEGHAWGMAIDTSACVGCNACILACQAENNIPIVGKQEVEKGRHMHWLRVDRYYSGDPETPETDFQPVPCMQCENAPCEPVCPVGATVHSDEGLNDMTYNRCVGTRYCSNNCPYKVRHFNFYQYADYNTASLKLMHNPDVTVRSRGVMEKCTYCVQRIQAGKIKAERDGRTIHDGEIMTACQQVCPAQAIVFGDINDPGSRVAQMKAQQHNYALLADLNTRPRTTYLGKVRNPNPEIETV